MTMRTLPAFLLCLLSPLLALAQDVQGSDPDNVVIRSPLFWYWMVALAIAVAAFIGVSFFLSRRGGGGPPSRPRIS
jgi:hypothetical protein